MKLIKVEKRFLNGYVRLVGIISQEDNREFEVYFEYPERFESYLCEKADPFIPALLLPSMQKGEDLGIIPTISKKLFQNLTIIQDIFTCWYPKFFKRVNVVDRYQQTSNIYSGVGQFFSLGVDSFYTLLKSMNGLSSIIPPVTHLIHMVGVETPFVNGRNFEKTRRQASEVARAVGKECICGITNIRNEFPLNWLYYYSGAGLASTALSLSSGFRYFLIPSTNAYNDLTPEGSSPLVDPLYSTEHTKLIHDGSEITRAQKIAKMVGHNSLALKYLRSCTANHGEVFNCGRCPKCIKTMLSLQVIGHLKDAETFPDHLPPRFLSILSQSEFGLKHIKENLELIYQIDGGDLNLINLKKKLEKAINFAEKKKAIKILINNTPLSCLLTIGKVLKNFFD